MTIVNPVTFKRMRQYEGDEYAEETEFYTETTPYTTDDDLLFHEDNEDSLTNGVPRKVTVTVKHDIPFTDDMVQVSVFTS